MGMKANKKKSESFAWLPVARCGSNPHSRILRRQKIGMRGAEDTKSCQNKGKLKNR